MLHCFEGAVKGEKKEGRLSRGSPCLACAVFALSMSVVGCAHGRLPEIPREQWRDTPRWPQSPNEARIVYVGEIRSNADIVESRGFWGALADGVLGSKEEIKLDRPFDVAVDSRGRVLVTDPGLRALLIFDISSGKTEIVDEFSGGRLVSPIGVTVDDRDNIYVADSVLNTIVSFDVDGNYREEIGGELLRRPTGITYNRKAKTILVADTLAHKIVTFTLKGVKSAEYGSQGSGVGQFNFPTFAEIDEKEHAWVVDSMNARIQQLDRDGKCLSSFGQRGDSAGDFTRPKGIAIDSEQHVYVVDAIFDNVQIFDQHGQLLLFFGKRGVGKGEFWLPAGIAIDDEDRIYVADSYNHRVQIFRYLKEGEFR